jgi:hypothetical protein
MSGGLPAKDPRHYNKVFAPAALSHLIGSGYNPPSAKGSKVSGKVQEGE